MKVTQKMKFLFLMRIMLIPVVRLLAQTDSTVVVIDPPGDIIDFVVNFDVFMASLGGLAIASVFLSGLINGWLKIVKSWVKQVVSWLVPVGLAVVATFVLKLGFLVDQPVLNVLIYSAAAGLVSNGIFDISFVNSFVNWIVGKFGGTTA